jgi:uncharacterized membrane protein YhaH (DUF805 family)
MSLTELLFSFKGRIRRLHWWVASLAAGAIASIVTAILEAVASGLRPRNGQSRDRSVRTNRDSWAVGGRRSACQYWIAFALSVKRLHDRDRSGWWFLWQILIVTLAVILIVVAVAVPKEQGPLWYALAGGASLATLVVSIWLFVQMGRRT